VHYRLLRHDPRDNTYTAHPLIRAHYFALFTKSGALEEKAAHEQIKDYYLSIAGETPTYPTLDDLKPLIEVVHHACAAGAYDDGFNGVCWERIYQADRRVIVNQIGAWETAYTLMLEFFPSGDTSQEPQVSDAGDKRWILNEIGLCLMNLGRLREAVSFYKRAAKAVADAQDWHNASSGYQNLAELHASLGALEASAEAARQALDLARRAENKQDMVNSMGFQAWAAHLLGDTKTASDAFTQAEKIEQESDSSVRYLYSLRGIQHADHLYRTGQADYARHVTEANLQILEQLHAAFQISQCHRVLGDLDADAGQHESARGHYNEALRFARGISFRPALIEVLLGRGRFYAKTSEVLKTSEVSQAFNDLNEALTYAVEGGYRIYEADVRNALGWAYLANGEKQKAKESAERALQMSTEMGYYWGKVDAEEVLKEIGNE
jgi:tetratricopeptide (TPR) repeat protein